MSCIDDTPDLQIPPKHPFYSGVSAYKKSFFEKYGLSNIMGKKTQGAYLHDTDRLFLVFSLYTQGHIIRIEIECFNVRRYLLKCIE